MFHHYHTPYQNIIYDDILLLFNDVNFNFVIILSAKSSSLATYDENGHFVMEYIPFSDQSKQRHEQIVTDDHFSSSGIFEAEAVAFRDLGGKMLGLRSVPLDRHFAV
jgi:hypothetical protein